MDRNIAEKRFFDFLNFFWNFLAGVQYQWNSGLKLFSPFPDLSHPVFAKNNAGKRFFKFCDIFCHFFRNFLNRVEYERNSELKFLPLFPDLSHPVLARNNTGNRFLNFSNFFAIFFGIFLPGSSMNGIGAKIFSSLSWPIQSRFS